MSGRKILQGAAFLAALSLCAPAGADTFAIDRGNQALAEDDTTFDVDCGGPVEDEAADCAERAAALHAELVDLLSGLSGESDARTVALFESVATMNDPQLQAMALRYFAAQQQAPVSLWDQAHQFFFGPDAVVGHPSAELLASSAEEIEQQRSEAYLEGRPLPNHGGELPKGAGFEDSWALGYAQDARLDDVPSFIEAELFPEATRLLMLDRFIVDAFDPDADPAGIAVTAFVTDADVSEVEAHFTSVFGAEPYPPVAKLEARQDELSAEFNELAMSFSDPKAVMRFQALTEELQKNQAALLVAGQIGLDSDEYADHVFWVTLSSDQFSTGPMPRAVTLGTDTRLEGHVIRYVNGAASDDVNSPNGPGSGGSNGEGDGAGGDNERAVKKGDSGCGCRTSPQGSLAPSLTALALLALTWKRRSRRRASS
jgi:MYXO-CTERM domain-containing protein